MRSNRKTLESILLSTVLISTLALAFISVPVIASPETYENFGPRVDNILIKVYLAGRDAEFEALRTGQIDIIDWPLDYTTYTQLLDDPAHYVVEPLTMIDMYNLEMNNIKWPTSDVNVRRAIAYLFDRQKFFQLQLKTFSGALLNSPIATEWTQWYTDTVRKYPYSRDAAAQILTDAGYQDHDSDGVREYYNQTSGLWQELPSLIFYIRSDDPDRLVWGRDYMLYEMVTVGLPVDAHIVPKTTCWEAVMKMPYNYHLYTGGWGPYRDPDFLYDQYHSKFGIDYYLAGRDWANNYVFFTNSTFDHWAELLKFAQDMDSAKEPCKKCQEILMDQVPMIPGWHSAGAIGYRKNYGDWAGEERYKDSPWTGIVNTKVISGMGTAGANSWWTFLNCHAGTWEKGGTIRYGFMCDADVFNPVQADFYWDWEFLNKVYDFLLTSDPYTGADIPWMAKSWTVGIWDNAGTPATKITLKLYDNILWHDNQPFTAHDVAFTFQYMKDAFASLFYPLVVDMDHATAVDDYTVDIYYKIQSCWALHWVGGIPMIPKHIWQNILPSESREKGEYETTGKLTGSGAFKYVSREKGQWILLTANKNYFRELIRPDYYTVGQPIPYFNGKVDIDDLGLAIGHFYEYYPWSHADRDPWIDVNKDLGIDIVDISKIAYEHYGKTGYKNGYPGWYFP